MILAIVEIILMIIWIVFSAKFLRKEVIFDDNPDVSSERDRKSDITL